MTQVSEMTRFIMTDKFIKHTKIEKLDISGAGIGECDNRTAYVYNALPGEEVEFRVFKKRRGRFEGIATKIAKISPDRIEAKEPEHYQSCSPWQIMSTEAEKRFKLELSKETYSSVGLVLPKEFELLGTDKNYHYRNKMEYSFTLDEMCDLSYAFFQRGRRLLTPIAACHLGSTAINETAERVLKWLNDNPISDEIIKSLVVRSNMTGETIVALFLSEHFNLPELPKLDEQLVGFHVYYSRPESPASTPDKLIYSEGSAYLTETIKGVKLRFGALSFFQINVPVFEIALGDIEPWLEGAKRVLDFYSGVGTISLPLHSKYKSAVLVDESRESIQYAKENIEANNLKNCEAILERSEKMTDLFQKGDTVILDPPRPGLHKKVVSRLVDVEPARIIYLSCNIKTQAENLKELKKYYDIKFARVYNFFPRTPHIEGLVVLDRK